MSAALVLLHGLPMEDGRPWREVAADFQLADAAAVLDPGAGPRLHFETRPKGGSKSTDLGAVLVAWLLEQAPPLARGYLAAGDEDQAGIVLDAIRGFVARDEHLRTLLKVDAGKVTALHNGATVEVLAADGPGTHGLLPHFIVVDELAQWKSTRNARQMWIALVSAIGKVPGARLVVLTTAGDPAHWSFRILEDARASVHWRVHEVDGPLPWRSSTDLAVQREALAGFPGEFERLHLNRWTASADRLVEPDDLEAAAVLDGPLPAQPGVAYVAGVDLGLRNDASVLAIAHLEEAREYQPGRGEVLVGTRVVVDRVRRWVPVPGAPVLLEEVMAAIREASLAYPGLRVRIDPFQAEQMTQQLRAHGVWIEAVTFSPASIGRFTQTLFRLLRDRTIWLPRDDALLEELEHVRLLMRNGLPRLDHDAGRHDDQAIAIALAASQLVGDAVVGTVPPASERVAVERWAGTEHLSGVFSDARPGTWEWSEQFVARSSAW